MATLRGWHADFVGCAFLRTWQALLADSVCKTAATKRSDSLKTPLRYKQSR